MAKRKYTSEFALNAESQLILVLQYEDLGRLAEFAPAEEYPCHIYLICRRPRITLDPDNFAVTPSVISGRFRIQRGPTHDEVAFALGNQIGRDDLQLECSYPHTHFALVSPNGDKISHGKVGLLAHFVPAMQDHLNLEVLYVGQAYGANGERTAPDRLKSHSTLLSIYAEAASRAPDQDIYIVLLNLRYILLSSFDGRDGDVIATDQEDTAHIDRVFDTKVPEQVWINLSEAALIRYFCPKYNVLFKDTFPNPAHGSYSLCYDIDLNTLVVALETSSARTQFWSAAAPASWTHIAQFALHSPDERRAMFDIS